MRKSGQDNKRPKSLGIVSLRPPGEAILPADQHPNAALVHLAAGLHGMFQFALISDADRRAGLDAPFAGMARGIDEPGEPGRDKMTIFGRLEPVERFLIGE